MTKIKDMADICEEAHNLTEIQCDKRGIKFEKTKDFETVYTTKAQNIFNHYYDKLIEKYNV